MTSTISTSKPVEFKESGTRWLGSIPAHWEVFPSKVLFRQRKERARADDIPLTASQDYGVIPQADFMKREGRRVVQVILNPEILKHVEKDDFVISMRSFQGGIERSKARGCISSAYVILEPTDLVVPSFFHYLLKSDRYISALQITSNLIRDGQALRYDNFRMVPLPVVPFEEQKAIANFLDRKTAAIDALVEKKEKLLELLAEKRSALINQAVTKGLDPNVPMKDSGIPWIGEIPEHWEVRPLGYRVSMQGGSTPSKQEERFWGGGIPWVSPKDMKRFEIDDSIDKLTMAALEETSIRLIAPGATLVVVRGMILARKLPVGLSVVPCTINQDMKAIIPGKGLDARYLSWQLDARTNEAMSLIEEAGHGTKTFRTDLFTKMKILIPPVSEQKKIIERLEVQLGAFDSADQNTRTTIERLKEYRQSLITAAVTGQLEIPAEDFETVQTEEDTP